MADLNNIQASETVKIVGSDSSGIEQTPVQSTSGGAVHSNLRNDSGTEIGTSSAPIRVDPTGTTNQPVLGANLTASGSASSLNEDLIASTDTSGYQSASIQITGTFVGTITFQGSNDNSNFTSIGVTTVSSPGAAPVTSTTTSGLFYAPLLFRYIRIRMTAYTSGTATATVLYDTLTPTDLGARSANLSSGQLVPTITNKLRFRYAIADVNLPNTGVYQTIYSRSGSGLFFGSQMGFDNAKVKIRLTLDGGVVFDLPLEDIKAFEFNDTTDGRMQMGGFLTAVGNFFDFSSRFAIPYSSSLLIEAAVTDANAHKLKQYLSIHTEDT